MPKLQCSAKRYSITVPKETVEAMKWKKGDILHIAIAGTNKITVEKFTD